jgi:hypothetical protein
MSSTDFRAFVGTLAPGHATGRIAEQHRPDDRHEHEGDHTEGPGGRADHLAGHFIRSTSVTHHTNTDQRFLPLKWAREGNCGLRITAPANAQLAPPGYYLLFILDDCGVPSMGRFIQLH